MDKLENGFTGFGRKNNIDFGDYVFYPNGCSNLLHLYKVIGALKSNTYQDPPDWSQAVQKIHDEIVPVLNIVHCGLDETRIIRVKEEDCILKSVV